MSQNRSQTSTYEVHNFSLVLEIFAAKKAEKMLEQEQEKGAWVHPSVQDPALQYLIQSAVRK